MPVGSRNPDGLSAAVSPFHGAWLGTTEPADPDGPAHELMASAFQNWPSTVLLSGAPLQNVRDLLRRHANVRVERWVAQGGFAGDNLVPQERRLAKFAGRTMSESHNFGGNKNATRIVLDDPRIQLRQLVAKNVTHGVVWDQRIQHIIGELDGLTAGARVAHDAMSVFLADAPSGKLLHDPLAACAAIDPGIIDWQEVRVTYEAGRWGAEPAPGSGTFISVGVDRAAFLRTLVAPAAWPEAGT